MASSNPFLNWLRNLLREEELPEEEERGSLPEEPKAERQPDASSADPFALGLPPERRAELADQRGRSSRCRRLRPPGSWPG